MARSVATLPQEPTIRWGLIAPWIDPEATVVGKWGLAARRFIAAAGYANVQALGRVYGLAGNKVVWTTVRDTMSNYCHKGKTYTWLTSAPARPAGPPPTFPGSFLLPSSPLPGLTMETAACGRPAGRGAQPEARGDALR